jgi:hypothetical protein
MDEINSAWRTVSWRTTEVFAVDVDRVLHRGDWGGEGAASGIETYSSVTGVFTVRADQISRAVPLRARHGPQSGGPVNVGDVSERCWQILFLSSQ